MASVKRLCVFCGASSQVDPAYREAATQLGGILAENGIELVFGGGRVGLMGLTADATLKGGGKAIGIIPTHLHNVEIGHSGLTELHVVETLHERKALMFSRADAFAILPGGLGTLDETFEIITWKQLGLHDKPIVIVDVEGYWAPLLHMIERVVATGFAPERARKLFETIGTVQELLPLLASLPEPRNKGTSRWT